MQAAEEVQALKRKLRRGSSGRSNAGTGIALPARRATQDGVSPATPRSAAGGPSERTTPSPRAGAAVAAAAGARFDARRPVRAAVHLAVLPLCA